MRIPVRTALLIAALAPVSAAAQAITCTPPARIDPYPPVEPTEPTIRMPATGYVLALSWSPEFCHGVKYRNGGQSQEFQCASGQNFGFIVHGLWPQSDGIQHPQWCALAPRPAPETLRRYMCMTPSARTLEHEWLKHGSCVARTPESYFAVAYNIWQTLRMPDMARLPRPASVGDLRDALVAANPSVPRRAFGVQTTQSGWLREVHLCLTLKMKPVRCEGRSFGASDREDLKVSDGR